MASFVATIRFTEQGIQAVHETTRRTAAFKGAAKKLGLKVTEAYWCLGSYDGLLAVRSARCRDSYVRHAVAERSRQCADANRPGIHGFSDGKDPQEIGESLKLSALVMASRQ